MAQRSQTRARQNEAILRYILHGETPTYTAHNPPSKPTAKTARPKLDAVPLAFSYCKANFTHCYEEYDGNGLPKPQFGVYRAKRCLWCGVIVHKKFARDTGRPLEQSWDYKPARGFVLAAMYTRDEHRVRILKYKERHGVAALMNQIRAEAEQIRQSQEQPEVEE